MRLKFTKDSSGMPVEGTGQGYEMVPISDVEPTVECDVDSNGKEVTPEGIVVGQI